MSFHNTRTLLAFSAVRVWDKNNLLAKGFAIGKGGGSIREKGQNRSLLLSSPIAIPF